MAESTRAPRGSGHRAGGSSGGELPRPPSGRLQALVVGGGLALAVGAFVFAAAYDEDTDSSEVAFTGSAAEGGGVRSDDSEDQTEEAVATPIEGWLPRSGAGSTCSEPVGVDLIPGYGALLIINGVPVDEALMNAPESASRSLGQFTYGPEEDCPNGDLLRPVDNTVQACVYRLEEGPSTCQLSGSFSFDAL